MYSFCILFAIIKTIEALVASEARTNPSLNNTFDNSLGDWNSSLKATADNLWNPDTFSVSLAVPDPVIYKCNGSLFQFDLSVSSCMNALTTSVFEWSSPTPKTFGRRHTGVQYDFPLPVRFVSSDGTCIIEPVVDPRFPSARASQEQVGMAAFALINACVNSSPSEGGMAAQIGDNGQLAVLVYKEQPSLRCYGKAEVAGLMKACQSILNEMDVSSTVQSFGDSPGVNVKLPYIMTSADGKCIVSLRTSGTIDLFSWRGVWSHASTITAMCAKKGQKGIWVNIGRDNNLYIEVAAGALGEDAIS